MSCHRHHRRRGAWRDQSELDIYRRGTGRVRLLLNIGADPNERVTPIRVDWTPLALWRATACVDGATVVTGGRRS